MPLPLTAKERAHLKSRAHSLDPVVQIGHEGLSEAVVSEIDRALRAHELIKIRAAGDDRMERSAFMEEICERTGAAPVQRVGKILVIWRPRPED